MSVHGYDKKIKNKSINLQQHSPSSADGTWGQTVMGPVWPSRLSWWRRELTSADKRDDSQPWRSHQWTTAWSAEEVAVALMLQTECGEHHRAWCRRQENRPTWCTLCLSVKEKNETHVIWIDIVFLTVSVTHNYKYISTWKVNKYNIKCIYV